MKTSIIIFVGAVVLAATGFAPAAYAKKHKAQAMMAMPANARVNSAGEFYATPMQTGMMGMGLPGLDVIPVAGGVAAGAVNGAGDVVTGITGPLLAPLK